MIESSRDSAHQRVAMLPIRRDDGVVRAKRLHHADGHRFFAVVEMQKASDLGLRCKAPRTALRNAEYAPSASGIRQREHGHSAAEAWVSSPIAHTADSNVDVSPSGKPEFAHLEQPTHNFTAAGSRQTLLEFDFFRRHHGPQLLSREAEQVQA